MRRDDHVLHAERPLTSNGETNIVWDIFQNGTIEVVRDFVQIGILAVFLYYAFRLVRGTRSAQMMLGLIVVVLTLIGLTIVFNLDVLSWLLGTFSVYLVVCMVGGGTRFGSAPGRPPVADELVLAVMRLAERRHGALIAIERDIALKGFVESGVQLDTPLSQDLLLSIFWPRAPLHDGGVILRGDRILAARCLFPLTQRVDDLGELGTRHRAALGLSEETDAVVIVVSEETGGVSVAHQGRLFQDLTAEKLRRYLRALLPEKHVRDLAWRRVVEDFVLGANPRAESDVSPEDRHVI